MHTTEMKMLIWIQGKKKERPNEKWKVQERCNGQEDTNVAKQVTMMTVGGKRPRGRPKLRWMGRVRSDLKHHKLDPKLAQNREARRKAIMAIDHGQG